MAKRYYWLKLKDDFFSSKRIKKLRKLAGGDTFTIIYLKMQLKAMQDEGVLTYSGIEKSLAEEIALDIDEDVENVAVTLGYLQTVGLVEMQGDDAFLPYAVENTGSETASAKRVRDHRDKLKALHCNTDVTEVKRLCNVEKEKREDIEKELDTETERREDNAPYPAESDYQKIVKAWNAIPHTLDISGIIPLSHRENELRLCIATFGIDSVMAAIQKICDSDWLKKSKDVRFDSYMNTNRIQKVLEGTYDRDFSNAGKQEEQYDDDGCFKLAD